MRIDKIELLESHSKEDNHITQDKNMIRVMYYMININFLFYHFKFKEGRNTVIADLIAY